MTAEMFSGSFLVMPGFYLIDPWVKIVRGSVSTSCPVAPRAYEIISSEMLYVVFVICLLRC